MRSSRLFLGIYTVLGYLFLYAPLAVVVLFSFNNAKFPSQWVGFTFRWYMQLFDDPELWLAVKTSLLVASTAVLLTLGMGLALMYYAHTRISKLFILFYANILIPEIVIAVGLLTVFSFCAIPQGIITLIAGHTLLGLGFVVPLLYARYAELDPALMQASHDLGATRAQTFFYVTVPLLKPAIIASAFLVLIISLDDFLLAFFCSGSGVQTLSLYIFSTVRTGISPMINALSTILLFLSGAVVTLLTIFKTRIVHSL